MQKFCSSDLNVSYKSKWTCCGSLSCALCALLTSAEISRKICNEYRTVLYSFHALNFSGPAWVLRNKSLLKEWKISWSCLSISFLKPQRPVLNLSGHSTRTDHEMIDPCGVVVLSRAARATAGYKWAYWIAVTRATYRNTITQRAKAPSISSTEQRASALCECTRDG
jgi:hypothetical protein